jgi:hypothetical protein
MAANRTGRDENFMGWIVVKADPVVESGIGDFF